MHLFERRGEVVADVRLARRALIERWQPKPEHTEAVLTKATMKALEDTAKVHEVVAVAKLHLDAYRQKLANEHHDDRMAYHERALELRSKLGPGVSGGGPKIGVTVEGGDGGRVSVGVYLPDNSRDPASIIDLPDIDQDQL